MELIDKAKVVEEIAGLKDKYALCPTRNDYEEGLKEGRLIGYKDALNKINSIEAKEVNLDLEITLWANAIPEIRFDDIERLAKYFFKLGIKAQKGEKV